MKQPNTTRRDLGITLALIVLLAAGLGVYSGDVHSTSAGNGNEVSFASVLYCIAQLVVLMLLGVIVVIIAWMPLLFADSDKCPQSPDSVSQ